MNSRSKSNNLIAILIAIILFAIGFALYFVHQQSQSDEQTGQGESPVSAVAIISRVPVTGETFRFVTPARLM